MDSMWVVQLPLLWLIWPLVVRHQSGAVTFPPPVGVPVTSPACLGRGPLWFSESFLSGPRPYVGRDRDAHFAVEAHRATFWLLDAS